MTMAPLSIWKCHRCGEEQRSDRDVYWAQKIRQVDFCCPADGINGGKVSALLCGECRGEVLAGIVELLKRKEAADA